MFVKLNERYGCYDHSCLTKILKLRLSLKARESKPFMVYNFYRDKNKITNFHQQSLYGPTYTQNYVKR